VITIGLATITYNPTATAIIIAAGEAKAPIVALAVQNKKGPQYPASVLQDLPNARFYLTKGAASKLVERQYQDFCNLKEVSPAAAEDIAVSLALATDKPLPTSRKRISRTTGSERCCWRSPGRTQRRWRRQPVKALSGRYSAASSR